MRERLKPETPVERFMRVDPPNVTADQPLSEAIATMLREQMEVLPVLAADGSRRVAGVISPIDVFRHMVAWRKSA